MRLPILVIAPPDSRRVRAFQTTLAELNHPPAQVVPYTDLISGKTALPELVQPGMIVRIESPGEDWETERLILQQGQVEDEEGDNYERANAEGLEFELGRLLPSRQWYLGFRQVLRCIQTQLQTCPPHTLMNHPDDILTMFDKRATHKQLEFAGVKVPPALKPISSFDDLYAQMQQTGWARVFVKLAHGSSAAGAVALETNWREVQATTTVEMVWEGGELKFYNSRRLIKYRSLAEVRTLIDALCRHRVHVERWLPKAGFEGKVFDLRVVVIGGQAKQVLVRLANGPMTNLHLKNERGDWEAVRERMGESAWAAAKATCEQAMACFPKSLYGGVDLLVSPGFSRHAVLEANAFGDYHRGVLVDGLDTYGSELQALLHSRNEPKGVSQSA